MNIELFFFDLEGTIFDNVKVELEGESKVITNLWTLLFHQLGEAAVAEEKRNHERWKRGGYRSYLDWADDSAAVLRKHGLTEEIFNQAISRVSYAPGVEKLFEELQRRDIRTAVISGGFYNHARRAQARLGINHVYAAVDLIWDETGRLGHWNVLPCDYEGKVDFVRLLEQEYELEKGETAFVGDEHNDVHIAREVGLSFACNAHSSLEQAADHSISHLTEILDHIPKN